MKIFIRQFFFQPAIVRSFLGLYMLQKVIWPRKFYFIFCFYFPFLITSVHVP